MLHLKHITGKQICSSNSKTNVPSLSNLTNWSKVNAPIALFLAVKTAKNLIDNRQKSGVNNFIDESLYLFTIILFDFIDSVEMSVKRTVDIHTTYLRIYEKFF